MREHLASRPPGLAKKPIRATQRSLSLSYAEEEGFEPSHPFGWPRFSRPACYLAPPFLRRKAWDSNPQRTSRRATRVQAVLLVQPVAFHCPNGRNRTFIFRSTADCSEPLSYVRSEEAPGIEPGPRFRALAIPRRGLTIEAIPPDVVYSVFNEQRDRGRKTPLVKTVGIRTG